MIASTTERNGLELVIPDGCGRDCGERRIDCPLQGAVFVTSLIFKQERKAGQPLSGDELTEASTTLHKASNVLGLCDVVVHGSGGEPLKTTMDLDGNLSFRAPYQRPGETVVQINRPSYISPDAIFEV